MITHAGVTAGQKGNLIAIECTVCGFIHLDPIPESNPYSSGEYHAVVKPSMESDYEQELAWHKAIFDDWLRMCPVDREHPRLLDVGAGTGHFTKHCWEKGYYAIGLEADHNMVKRNKEILHWCEYKDYAGTGDDIVSAHWLMEHLADPHGFLDWTRKRLTKDGWLLVTIPNDFTAIQLGAMKVVDKPYYWLNEHHTNYWNAASFHKLLHHHGFNIELVYGSWQPEYYLANGLDYLNDHQLGRSLHRVIESVDLTYPEERYHSYLVAGEQGRGRDLTFAARMMR